jgi:hypothetical protein
MSMSSSTNDYTSMTYTIETYRNDLNLPPIMVSEGGRITVTYRFLDGHAVVTSSKYESDRQ